MRDRAYDEVSLGTLLVGLALALALALFGARAAHAEPVECVLGFDLSPFTADEVRATVTESACGAADLEVLWRVIVERDGRLVSTARARASSPAFLTVERGDVVLQAQAEIRDLRADGRLLRRGGGVRFTYDGQVHRLPPDGATHP